MRAIVPDRPWPILTAAQADDEIARLRAQLKNTKAENAALRSAVRSLLQAVAEQQDVIRVAARNGRSHEKVA